MPRIPYDFCGCVDYSPQLTLVTNSGKAKVKVIPAHMPVTKAAPPNIPAVAAFCGSTDLFGKKLT